MNTFSTKHSRDAYTAAQERFVRKIAAHCQYAITLQTNLKTYGRAQSTVQRYCDELVGSVTYFRTRLNRLLTGNGHKRNHNLKPIFVASIEGTQNTHDRHRTLHAHIALGNTGIEATQTTMPLLEQGVRTIWLSTDVGIDDIVLVDMQHYDRQGWGGYLNKEAYEGNTGVIDYSNTQLPQYLINTLEAF